MTDLLPGVEIEMSGRKWTVPPLTLGQLRRLGPSIRAMRDDRDILDSEVIDAVVSVVAAALRRNYPDLDEAAVAEMLDVATAPAVFAAVLTGTGLKRGVAGDGPFGSAGPTSTASSPQASGTGPATSTS